MSQFGIKIMTYEVFLIAFLIDYFLFESKGQNSNDEKDLFLLSSLDDLFTCIILKVIVLDVHFIWNFNEANH